MLCPTKWNFLLPRVPKHFFKQFITVPREVGCLLISQWGKAGKCSRITEGHTSKQWPAQEGHPAIQTWQLQLQSSSPRAAPPTWASTALHIRNLVEWWDDSVSALRQSAKGFFFQSEHCHKHSSRFHLIRESNSESSLCTRVLVPGSFSLRGKLKILRFLQNPAVTSENPNLSLHGLIRCHLPTHQLSCNQRMPLPTWHSLCLAQLHPDTPTLSYLWLSKSICPWIDSVCTDIACCWSSSRNFGWLTQYWTCEKGPAYCGHYYK